MRTIRLGDSAFSGDKEVFLPVDVNKEKKSLQQQGTENGKINSPASVAIRPDDVEQGIIQRIAQTAQQTQADLSQHFVDFHGRLLPIVETWDVQALTNHIEGMPARLKNALNDTLDQFEAESAIRGPKWRDAQKDYEKFRNDNNLLRPADYSSKGLILAWFLSLIIVEATFNASLLWELTGFLLAFAQTSLITAVNVLFGASMMGLLLRYKNHVSPHARRLTWLCIPVIFAVLIFNLGVGHYRDALVEAKVQAEQLLLSPDWDEVGDEVVNLGFVDYTQRAMENILTSFWDIDSIFSVLLIIVGIGFFGVAAYKWYSIWDPYPGYRRCDIALKKAHENYKNLVSDTRNKVTEKFQDSVDRARDESTKVTNMRQQYNELRNRAESLRQSYANWVLTLGQTQTTLLEIYRNSNRQARDELPPEYFDNEIVIENALVKPPNFDPPELGDMDAVVEAVRVTEEKMNEISGEVLEKFNALANMQHYTNTPLEIP